MPPAPEEAEADLQVVASNLLTVSDGGGGRDDDGGKENVSPEVTHRPLGALYTTSLRGVHKTFEDCTRVLEGFLERDVSMLAPYRDELRGLLPLGTAMPPRLFVDGRYIGGANEVVALHKKARLPSGRAMGELHCAVWRVQRQS